MKQNVDLNLAAMWASVKCLEEFIFPARCHISELDSLSIIIGSYQTKQLTVDLSVAINVKKIYSIRGK